MYEQFLVGFSRVDITPHKYGTLSGYGNDIHRKCDNILDRPSMSCTILQDAAGERFALFSVDTLCAEPYRLAFARQACAKFADIPQDRVLLNGSHTHSGSSLLFDDDDDIDTYIDFLTEQFEKAVKEAVQDLKPAKASIGRCRGEKLCFKRHYKLEDGTVSTNGNNPNRLKPVAHVGQPDEEIQVIQFVREGGRDVVLVNFQCHATCTSDSEFSSDMSADFPGTMRNHLEGSTGCLSAYLQGAAGDLVTHSRIPHLNNSYDNYVAQGRALADCVIDCLQNNMKPVDLGPLQFRHIVFQVPIDHTMDHLLENANKVQAGLYDLDTDAQRREFLKEMGIRSIQQSRRIIECAKRGEFFPMDLYAVAAGDISFATAPFEMFSSNGKIVKENTPYEMAFMCAYTNDAFGYVPDDAAYDYESCYEVDFCYFKRGSGEAIAKALVDTLKEMKN